MSMGLEALVADWRFAVGPYGFLAGKEVLADGDVNNGLKDQRLALQ